MLQEISFTNYKLFKTKQTLVLKPLTLLIGKNSSGKSAIAKLLSLIDTSLSGSIKTPFYVEGGTEFRDLLYGRLPGQLTLEMKNHDGMLLKVVLANAHTIKTKVELLEFILSQNGRQTMIDPPTNYRGFVPADTNFPLAFVPAANFPLTFDTEYIGPIRKSAERYYNIGNLDNDKVGSDGEQAYSMLIEDSLLSQPSLIHAVSKEYQENFEGWAINVNSDRSPDYQIELVRDSLKINLKDVGQGMIQALPLVVRALQPILNDRLIMIEQPELHLHPAAHGNMAQLFAESIQTDPHKHYLIETHAQNFVLRLRRLIAEGSLDKDKVALYYVDFDEDKNESNLKRININDDGEVDYWPEHIFNESLHEALHIRKAQRIKTLKTP